MSDHATASGDDAFTPEEQAQFDAYERGEDGPAAPAGGDEPAAAAPVATDAAALAPAAPGEPAAAPGDVVDPDAEDADDPEANKGRFVRHGAFHKERERRKAVERELSEYREKFARGDERMRLLTEAMRQAPQSPAAVPAQAEPETPPDPSEDIFGYAKWLERQVSDLRNGHQQVTETQKQEAESRRAADEERTIVSTYQQDIARVMQADTSFGDAYRFLVEGRVAELKLYGLDEATAIKQANADELSLVRSAMQQGRSPAELMGQLAKSRGFAPKAPAPAAPATPAETPEQKAARNAAGQAGPGRSLSAAGGGPAGEVTLELLAGMSEAEFGKFAAANPAKLAALMGG